MNIKSFITVSALVVSMFSTTSSAALKPLTQVEREARASDIVTGYVTSVRKVVRESRDGFLNTHYSIQMIVSDVSKGTNALGGKTVAFHYWKELERPAGWCGDSGQFGSIKHYQVIKAYLNFDELSNSFHLLNPNGFDLIEKR